MGAPGYQMGMPMGGVPMVPMGMGGVPMVPMGMGFPPGVPMGYLPNEEMHRNYQVFFLNFFPTKILFLIFFFFSK